MKNNNIIKLYSGKANFHLDGSIYTPIEISNFIKNSLIEYLN